MNVQPSILAQKVLQEILRIDQPCSARIAKVLNLAEERVSHAFDELIVAGYIEVDDLIGDDEVQARCVKRVTPAGRIAARQ